jgi:hypothetical protein
MNSDVARQAIERFLATSRQPTVIEAGEGPVVLTKDNFTLETRQGTLIFSAWNETRNFARRVNAIEHESRGRLELAVERFGKRIGTLVLVDANLAKHHSVTRRGERMIFRERLRWFLRRQFVGWKLEEISSEPNLESSLSPSYPRAFLRKGRAGMAAIGASPDCNDVDGVLSFGLIWLDYLRRREPGIVVEGLAILLPAGRERTTASRLRHLSPQAARYELFVHSEDGHEDRVDLQDYGNLDTCLDVRRQPLTSAPAAILEWAERLEQLEGVERINCHDGSVSFRVRGMEFARATATELLFGIETKRPATASTLQEIEQVAGVLRDLRRKSSLNPIAMRNPEAWLESQVRQDTEVVDARLVRAPIYGQAPMFAGGDRGVIDLLGIERRGRLAIIELKASEDIHLPLQGLDYWMRVKWHLDKDEFATRGYFPGVTISKEPPRMLLVAPALSFHSTNETVLRYFASYVEVERVGVSMDWREKLAIMFRYGRPDLY